MNNVFDEKRTIDLLGQLVNIPSPSGYTATIMQFIGSYLKTLGLSISKQIKVQ